MDSWQLGKLWNYFDSTHFSLHLFFCDINLKIKVGLSCGQNCGTCVTKTSCADVCLLRLHILAVLLCNVFNVHTVSGVCVFVCVCVLLLASFSVPWLQCVCPLIDHGTLDLMDCLFSFSLCACPPLSTLNIVSCRQVIHIQWINYKQHHRSTLAKCRVCSHPTKKK